MPSFSDRATLLTACAVTAASTALLTRWLVTKDEAQAKDAAPVVEAVAMKSSPGEILGASSWASADFAEKYNSARGNAPANSGASDATATQTAELMRLRRSIFPKDFTPGVQVDLSFIEEALAAANWAPTHGKTEPWRFVVAGPETVQRAMAIRDGFMVAKLTAAGDEAGLAAHKKKFSKKVKELANCSAVIFIVVARVKNGKGGYMPEWEEVAAVSCAMENLHLQLAARWQDGVGGYWSSGGYYDWLQSPDLRALLGAKDGSEEGAPGPDLVLGAFYLGACPPEKMDAYRAKRGDIREKVQWLY
jgi:nitroreductase